MERALCIYYTLFLGLKSIARQNSVVRPILNSLPLRWGGYVGSQGYQWNLKVSHSSPLDPNRN